ncbi:tyrosine-type recombinase/integrase [Clostridium beijerinckii]|nr:phage integrase N-terminal SAM-like domain-containing protein [Clostridium beijerinckii]NRY04478.1 integrase [Clostridium beijerinckii]
MNNLISGINSSDSCCLKYELIKNYTTSSNMNDMILKYFSYKYIFEKKASRYFAEFQGFKVKSLSNSSKSSIKQYQSANYNFFEYITNSINYAVKIDDLTSRYLIEYFRFLLEQKKLKPVTIVNKYRYIKSFVDFLEKEDILNNKNDFTKITENSLMQQLNLTIENIVITPVTQKEITLLLDYQKNDTRNGLRNILITKLICYLALDINTLSNIKFDDLKFNKKSCSLIINNRTLPIPESMIDDFIKYKKQWEKDKVKIPYLFYTTYKEDSGKHRQIKTGTIHEIINQSFNKIESIEKSRRKHLTYSLLKASAIKYLYDNKFSLEEISAISGLNIDSILKYLDTKEINKRCANLNNHLLNNHPLSKLF